MILNYTPFAADVAAGWDHQLCAYHVVLIAAAFEATPGNPVRPVDPAGALNAADVFFGVPGQSSVRYEADIAPEKRKVDVLVNGRAHSPSGHKIDKLVVAVQVGEWRKELLVTGDRATHSSRPRPFVTMPIVYERAFGGTIESNGAFFPLNPVGVGYKNARPRHPSIDTAVPNVEYSHGRDAPAGFGPVSRQWRPRLDFAGTYDDKWLKSRCPLLPADFDPKYHQCAPVDQQLNTLNGGESVEVSNMTPDGVWRFRVPTLRVPLHLWYPDRGEISSFRVDTLQLEPDTYRVVVKGRAKIPILRNRAPLRQVIVGHVMSGWWIARVKRKMYLDWRQQNGREMTASDFDA